MNIEANSLEDYVNFVDTTRKLNRYFKLVKYLIAIIITLF